MANQTIEILVEGGKATPGPPLGPAIGPLGINMMQVVDAYLKKIKNKPALESNSDITVTEYASDM